MILHIFSIVGAGSPSVIVTEGRVKRRSVPLDVINHEVEIHHVTPVSEGGLSTLENLMTLCSAHHRIEHSIDRYQAS